MATLQLSSGFIASPSPALSAAPTGARPPSVLPVGRSRRAHSCFPSLALRPGETAALRCPCLVVRAQSRRGKALLPEDPNHYLEEREFILSRFSKILVMDEGYMYRKAIDMSADFCVSAEKALRIASRIVDSANLNPGSRCEISMDTVHMTLGTNVHVFVQAADDCYNRRVKTNTVLSFLGALKGLGFVSHILFEAALEDLSHVHPRESLSEYAFNYDVKAIHHEFNQKMSELEDGIRNSSTSKQCELLASTIYKGAKSTESFVGLMLSRRQRALAKAIAN